MPPLLRDLAARVALVVAVVIVYHNALWASFFDDDYQWLVGSLSFHPAQLVAFSTNGYLGDGSPDRADALIWGLTEIFPRVVSRGDGDWKTTRPHRDRPQWANVGYASAKDRVRRSEVGHERQRHRRHHRRFE